LDEELVPVRRLERRPLDRYAVLLLERFTEVGKLLGALLGRVDGDAQALPALRWRGRGARRGRCRAARRRGRRGRRRRLGGSPRGGARSSAAGCQGGEGGRPEGGAGEETASGDRLHGMSLLS